MDRFLTFLGEAFPPPKKPSFGKKPEKPANPFEKKEKANPGFGQEAAGDDPKLKADDAKVGPGEGEQKTSEFDQQQSFQQGPPQQGPPGAFGDPLAQMKWEAEQEQEKQELLIRQQRQAEADAEAAAVKKLRAQAEAEVAAALEDKYNDQEDEIEFYPEILTFGQFTKDGKQDAGGDGQQPGSVGNAPGDRAPEDAGKDGKDPKLKDTAKKQDARQDEEDSTDPNPDEDDEEDDENVEAQRQKRQNDNEKGDEAKKSNKQQKKW